MLPEGGVGVAGDGGVTNVAVPPASDCTGPCTVPTAVFRTGPAKVSEEMAQISMGASTVVSGCHQERWGSPPEPVSCWAECWLGGWQQVGASQRPQLAASPQLAAVSRLVVAELWWVQWLQLQHRGTGLRFRGDWERKSDCQI